MSGSILLLFFVLFLLFFTEEAAKDRELNQQMLQPCTIKNLQFVFIDSSLTDPNLTNFWETLLPDNIFVCFQLDIYIN